MRNGRTALERIATADAWVEDSAAAAAVLRHSGCGAPVILREFSGGASVPKEIGARLDEYGELEAQSLVVADRCSTTSRNTDEDNSSQAILSAEVARLAPAVDDGARGGRVDAKARGRREVIDALRAAGIRTQERTAALVSRLEGDQATLATMANRSTE